ncbi:MAG: O-antigen ligase family protein [Anaerolineae bacterium]
MLHAPAWHWSGRPLAIGLALLLLAVLIVFLPAGTALAVIGGGLATLALLRWPGLALYLLVFAIPFGSLVPLPLAGANVTAADGLLLVAFGLWLARQVAQRAIILKPASLVIPFLLFFLAIGLSTTVALSLQAAVKELTKWGEMLLAYWLMVQDIPEDGRAENRVKVLLAVIFLSGVAEALVGVNQYFLRIGPEGFVLNGTPRAFGTFDQPNPFAGYLGLIIPLSFGVFLGSMTLGRKLLSPGNLALAGLAVLAFGVMLASLLFSLSRGAWVGVAAALGLVWALRSKRAALFGLGLAVLVAMTALLGQLNVIPDVVTSRFAGVSDYFGLQDVRGVKVTDANFAIVERMAHWQAGLDMFQDHPWLGVGIGNYAAVYPAYSLPHWDDPLGHAHNYYINILAESGIVGMAGYILLWTAVFWLAWRTVRATHGLWQGIAAGAFGVLVALSVHNLFDNLFVHSMQMQVGLTLGMIESIKRKPRDVESAT